MLQQLAAKGHKVSKEKWQLSLNSVHYLGHNLSAGGIQLFPKRIKLTRGFPKPTGNSFMGFWAWLAIADCGLLIFLC